MKNGHNLTPAIIEEEVAGWSREAQLELIHSLLANLKPNQDKASASMPPISTLEQAAGLLRNDNPVPSDEDIARILRERREEKYG